MRNSWRRSTRRASSSPRSSQLDELVRFVADEAVAVETSEGVGDAGVGDPLAQGDVAHAGDPLLLLQLQDDFEVILQALGKRSDGRLSAARAAGHRNEYWPRPGGVKPNGRNAPLLRSGPIGARAAV